MSLVLEAIRVINTASKLYTSFVLPGLRSALCTIWSDLSRGGNGPHQIQTRLIKTHQECKCIQAASLTITKQFLPCVSASKAVLVIIGELPSPSKLDLDPLPVRTAASRTATSASRTGCLRKREAESCSVEASTPSLFSFPASLPP